MKSSKLIAFCLTALSVVSCGKSAKIKGTLTDAPGSQVVVKLLDVNNYKILDTVKVDKSGKFSYKVEVVEGQPEFVYLYRGDTKIASLILLSGDKVGVEADTLGNYTVTGSEESVKLQEVEKKYSAFLSDLIAAYTKMQTATESEAKQLNKEISRKYVEYYREAVKYVVANPKSMSSVNVLFQKVNDSFQIFSRTTDAMHFSTVADSLKTLYPQSKYVKALQTEAQKRFNSLDLSNQILNASEIGYPELNLPNINGERVSLTDLDDKVILLHFWTSSDAAQVLFNTEALLPLYKQYHSKGLEIYSVAIDVDKAAWATVVKNQDLPWINVCDGLGSASPAISLFNVLAIPETLVISNGTLANEQIPDGNALKKYLERKLN